MKLPREMSGHDLARRLARAFGYDVVHQQGSHLVLQANDPGRHRIVVPAHKSVRIGTLNAILNMVARAQGLAKDEVARRLFG